MSGEKNIDVLVRNMSPSLQAGIHVYCCLSGNELPAGVRPIATFREAEGLTVIMARDEAIDAGLDYRYECAWVTLNVHSSLQAVGFIALISASLARAQISCNVVSAFHHDHLFVPFETRERVLQLLHELTASV